MMSSFVLIIIRIGHQTHSINFIVFYGRNMPRLIPSRWLRLSFVLLLVWLLLKMRVLLLRFFVICIRGDDLLETDSVFHSRTVDIDVNAPVATVLR